MKTKNRECTGILLTCSAAFSFSSARFFVPAFITPLPVKTQMERLPVVLLTTSRCYRELVSPPIPHPPRPTQPDPMASGSATAPSPTKARPAGPLTAAAAALVASAASNNSRGSGGGSGGGGSSSNSVAGGGSCKGEFDPLIETVKAARSCSTIITSLLTFPRPGPLLEPGTSAVNAAAAAAGGRGVVVYGGLSLTDRASMAMDMVSSTSFGEAVREALVRSPSRELRTNAVGMLASLARIDREIAAAMYADCLLYTSPSPRD